MDSNESRFVVKYDHVAPLSDAQLSLIIGDPRVENDYTQSFWDQIQPYYSPSVEDLNAVQHFLNKKQSRQVKWNMAMYINPRTGLSLPIDYEVTKLVKRVKIQNLLEESSVAEQVVMPLPETGVEEIVGHGFQAEAAEDIMPVVVTAHIKVIPDQLLGSSNGALHIGNGGGWDNLYDQARLGDFSIFVDMAEILEAPVDRVLEAVHRLLSADANLVEKGTLYGLPRWAVIVLGARQYRDGYMIAGQYFSSFVRKVALLMMGLRPTARITVDMFKELFTIEYPEYHYVFAASCDFERQYDRVVKVEDVFLSPLKVMCTQQNPHMARFIQLTGSVPGAFLDTKLDWLSARVWSALPIGGQAVFPGICGTGMSMVGFQQIVDILNPMPPRLTMTNFKVCEYQFYIVPNAMTTTKDYYEKRALTYTDNFHYVTYVGPYERTDIPRVSVMHPQHLDREFFFGSRYFERVKRDAQEVMLSLHKIGMGDIAETVLWFLGIEYEPQSFLDRKDPYEPLSLRLCPGMNRTFYDHEINLGLAYMMSGTDTLLEEWTQQDWLVDPLVYLDAQEVPLFCKKYLTVLQPLVYDEEAYNASSEPETWNAIEKDLKILDRRRRRREPPDQNEQFVRHVAYLPPKN